MTQTSPDPAPVLLSFDGAVAILSLNRPAVLNAVDEALSQAFLEAVRIIGARDDVRAILIRGEGRAFMAGGDLSRFQAEIADGPAIAEKLIAPLSEAVALLAEMPVPVLACLKGAVAGAGFSLACAADLAVAADNTRFSFAYARVGTNPDISGTWTLPRLVGMRNAMGIALLGDMFGAEEALRLGLVNCVVPLAEVEIAALALARQLAEGPTLALASTKKLVRQADATGLRTQMQAELQGFQAMTRTADFAEGVAAFHEKRMPAFIGR